MSNDEDGFECQGTEGTHTHPFLLVPAYPGSPGSKAIKTVVCVCVLIM